MKVAFLVKTKQGYIYSYLLENNMSQKELARQLGISQQLMGAIINFRWLPNLNRPSCVQVIEKLENFFHVPIDVLFPPELTQEIAEKLGRKRVVFKEVDCLTLNAAPEKFLICDTRNVREEMALEIDDVLSTLKPLEEKVIRLTYGLVPTTIKDDEDEEAV